MSVDKCLELAEKILVAARTSQTTSGQLGSLAIELANEVQGTFADQTCGFIEPFIVERQDGSVVVEADIAGQYDEPDARAYGTDLIRKADSLASRVALEKPSDV